MLTTLIIFLPLFSFLISGISSLTLSKKNSDFISKIITVSFLITSATLAIVVFQDVYKSGAYETKNIFSFISSGNFSANWAIKVDQLTAVMLVVVTLVSSLVHIYSLGYMACDRSIARFMAYLSLFTFFMLALVTADNFLQLFFGWEGVGLASYLLIGFWFEKQSACNAAIKAFITNRIGDFGLIIAIALIYLTFGTVEYAQVFSNVSNHLSDNFAIFGHQFNNINAICILLFVGAMGKSAQIGLHVWLADAMEGPTPVSALIHAATMVTAGVFLVARCSPIFEYSKIALMIVTLVGALTAIFAATIAITQNDIKKIIAYSTCSQLGYMFFACGLSVYSAGIFHLATHGFFKALLFLSAGSVIHAMHHEQDIRKMGCGLWKKIPITYIMMWIGSLALAGFPPFSGFFSKDIILESAFVSEASFGKLAFYLGITAAFLTAFYSWRLLFLVFHNKNSPNEKNVDHAHESPFSMLFPLFVLAFGSIFAGIFGANFLGITSTENNFFADSIFLLSQSKNLLEEAHHAPTLVKLAPTIVGIIAIFLAYIFYIAKTDIPKKLSQALKPLYQISLNKYYFDEFYEKFLVSKTKYLGNFLWKFCDVKIIDGLPNSVALACRAASSRISKLQTGYIYDYCLWMVVGIITILFIFIANLMNVL
jgi:NADH-quinone oxidoreductase subunit L